MREPSESVDADGNKPTADHAVPDDVPNDPFPTTRVNEALCVDRNFARP